MIWLTNIGIIEKGRLIEIEALYVSLCGLAIIFWLSFFLQKKIAVADVASGIRFSRAWSAGKRADAPHIFLRDCHSRSRLLERLAGSCSSCTFCRACRHDWDRGGMGNSIRPRH